MTGYPRINHADGSGLDGVEIIAERPRAPKTAGLNELARLCHHLNLRWWQHADGTPKERNKGELIALMHSELSEALEGVRKGLPDDHLPHRSAEEVELVDLLIRVFDYAGGFELDLDGAFAEKMIYNEQRADHTHAARQAPGGKSF